MNIPMSGPDLTEVELTAINEVLKTSFLSFGPQLRAFEAAFANAVGTTYAVGVNSGTSGLHLCTIAAGLTEGDLALTTPFSFIASANSLLYERSIPIFIDVDPLTNNLNPTMVAEAASNLAHNPHSAASKAWLPPAFQGSTTAIKQLKALLVVHAFGQPAAMDELTSTAQQHGLFLIEDACEALGSTYKGRKVGNLGDVAAFGFYPNKQITTGEGGMICTNQPQRDNLFRSLRNQGRDTFDCWLNHTRLGYNYRLDELSAALGLAQLQRLESILAKRAQVAQWYNERLDGVELLALPQIAQTTTLMSWFVYVVRVLPPANRDDVLAQLEQANIPTRPYFTPIHLQPFYREKFGYHPGCFPVTEYLGQVSLALPFSSVMTEQQVDYVCYKLQKVLTLKSKTKPLPSLLPSLSC